MKTSKYCKLSDEIFELINSVRTNPTCIKQKLTAMKNNFKGKLYEDSELSFYMETVEGALAV